MSYKEGCNIKAIKLSKEQYRKLAFKVICRDGRKCRKCGARQGLTVHHIIKRSKLRLDVEWNLITLCQHPCHDAVEGHTVVIEQGDDLKYENEIDANNHVKFTRTYT